MPTIAHFTWQVAVEPKRTVWELRQRNPNPLGLGGVREWIVPAHYFEK